jgi:hypothetical protein
LAISFESSPFWLICFGLGTMSTSFADPSTFLILRFYAIIFFFKFTRIYFCFNSRWNSKAVLSLDRADFLKSVAAAWLRNLKRIESFLSHWIGIVYHANVLISAVSFVGGEFPNPFNWLMIFFLFFIK